MKNKIKTWRERIKFEYKISLLYFIVGILWIYFSDSFFSSLITDEEILKTVSIVKGSLYVLVTSLLLFYLVQRNRRQLYNTQKQLRQSISDYEAQNEEYKQVNQQLQVAQNLAEQNAEWLQKLIRKSPLPMVITDENQDVELFNEKFTAQFGYTKEDVVTAERWWQLAYPDAKYRQTVQQAWQKAIDKAVQNNTDIETQYWEMTIKDRTKRNCEFYMVPLGERSLIVVKDITEELQNRKALVQAKEEAEDSKIQLKNQNDEYATLNEEYKAANEELLDAKDNLEKTNRELKQGLAELKDRNHFIQTVLDNLPIGLSLNMINEGEATYMNHKFEEIYGWPAGEITSIASFFEKVYPDAVYREQIMQRIMADINSGDVDRMHWENIEVCRKDGTRRVVNAVNIPLPEQNTMVSTVMDVTALIEIQEELLVAKEAAEESNQLKTLFLQNMSHEIRTPMNAIVGFAGMLDNPELSHDKRMRFTDIIRNSSQQLLAVVTDILTISAIETGQESVRIEELHVNKLINELFTIFKPQADKKELEIYTRTSLSEKQAKIRTDKTKVTQVLTNLLANAFKFTHRGFVEIGYSLLDKTSGKPRLEFYVKDSGIGIRPDQQRKIFERFSQADELIQQNYGGTGLGLSISQGFAELLGGDIRLESEYGKGTTFYFSIPYMQADAPVSIKNVVDKQLKDRTILVAEDEEYNYLYLKELLQSRQVNLLRAKNGQESIDLYKQNQAIDLILMDIKMPVMDGYVAATRIKKLNAQIPIIAQSAYALGTEIAHYGHIFDDYLTKPIDHDRLLEVLNKFMPENQ